MVCCIAAVMLLSAAGRVIALARGERGQRRPSMPPPARRALGGGPVGSSERA